MFNTLNHLDGRITRYCPRVDTAKLILNISLIDKKGLKLNQLRAANRFQ
jgi:hypothetical protein